MTLHIKTPKGRHPSTMLMKEAMRTLKRFFLTKLLDLADGYRHYTHAT